MKALACVGLVALSSACLDREVSFHFTSGTSSDGTLSDVTRPMMVGTTEITGSALNGVSATMNLEVTP